MSKGTKIGAWVYGVQAFIVLPWFLGAIYRQEQSLWVWEEYAYALRKHGQGDALFILYLYGIFYAAFFVIPYAASSLRFHATSTGASRYIRAGRLMFASWFAVTFFVFAHPVFAFIRALPSEIWNGWLLICWSAATVLIALVWWDLEKVRAKNARGTERNR